MKLTARQVREVGRVAGRLLGFKCSLEELKAGCGFRDTSAADRTANFLLGYVVLALKKKGEIFFKTRKNDGPLCKLRVELASRPQQKHIQTNEKLAIHRSKNRHRRGHHSGHAAVGQEG